MLATGGAKLAQRLECRRLQHHVKSSATQDCGNVKIVRLIFPTRKDTVYEQEQGNVLPRGECFGCPRKEKPVDAFSKERTDASLFVGTVA